MCCAFDLELDPDWPICVGIHCSYLPGVLSVGCIHNGVHYGDPDCGDPDCGDPDCGSFYMCFVLDGSLEACMCPGGSGEDVSGVGVGSTRGHGIHVVGSY